MRSQTFTPLKLRVFVDDITALQKGESREVAEMAKKVFEEVDLRMRVKRLEQKNKREERSAK